MELINNEYGKEIDCVCGAEHKCGTKFFYGDIARIASLMPRGVHIIYAGANEKTRQELSRVYRTSVLNPLELTLRHYSGTELKMEFDCSGGLGSGIKGFEDLKLVAGEGDGAAVAKLLSSRLNIKLVLFGAQGLSRFAYIINQEIKNVDAKPDAVFLRHAETNEAALSFCECVNVLLSLIDWEIGALLSGVKMCSYVFKEAKRAVLLLIKTAKVHGRNSMRLKNALMQTQMRLCVLSSYAKDNVLNCSGAHQAAAAMGLLFNHEKRALKDISVNTFLLSPFVLRLYAAFLESKVTYAPPPDNNFRSKRLIQFLGLSPAKAYSLMSDLLSFNQTELGDYRLSLYAEPLTNRVYDTLHLIDDCYALWLRLFDDDGFWVKDYITNSDLGVCLSLGADVLSAPTLLNYMRQKGVLDKFI